MQLTHYQPWSLLNRFQNGQARSNLFDQLLNEMAEPEASTLKTGQWLPAVDIKEEENRYLIHADIPGVDPKDIEITADSGVLTIKGERSVEKEDKQEGYTRRERSYGSFYRSFTLPDNADTDHIEAKGKDGVLEIALPKAKAKLAKRSTVKS